MEDDSSATRRGVEEIRKIIREIGPKKATMPIWLVVVIAVFPMTITFLSVAGAAYVGSYRLNEVEKVMARIEGALSTITLIEYRVTTLEKENLLRERDIRMVETIARDNKTNVRTVAHDVATFRTFLPTAVAAEDEKGTP